MLFFDFETRGTVDLRETGAAVYAAHPETDIWIGCYAFDDEPVDVWSAPEKVPNRIVDYVTYGGLVAFHNAAFDVQIWNKVAVRKYGFPAIEISQVRDSLAMAYALALPGSLERAAAAVGLDAQKDTSGSRVMLQLAKPRRIEEGGTIVWWDDPAKIARLIEYGKQDVETQRQLYRKLRSLSKEEQAVWEADFAINERGIKIDLPAVLGAIQIVEKEKVRLNKAMRAITGGQVDSCSAVSQLSEWIKQKGIDISGVAKSDVIDLLARDNLPDHVRKALTLRQEAAKTSTAKLQKMLSCAGTDGRVRGVHQYHGAATGRWAGRLLQTQNLKRPSLKQKDIDSVIDLLKEEKIDDIDILYGPPLSVVSDCLRGLITAEDGHDLIAADFSNIEGRVLAWLAGEDWKLKAFEDFDKGFGPDIYLVAAGQIYGTDPSAFTDKSPERQIGKVAELALGYQGGVGAFKNMAGLYGVQVSDERANSIKEAWRTANAKIKQYWYDLETAAINAVRAPGEIFNANTIKFIVKGSFLWCRLPSGRYLSYPFPKLKQVETPWGDFKEQVVFMGESMVAGRTTKNWQEINIYGGKWAENVTQAAARDLLASALLRINDAGYHVVMHIHDEIVSEVPKNFGSVLDFENIMCQLPEWAAGLPVVAQGWRGLRYRK